MTRELLLLPANVDALVTAASVFAKSHRYVEAERQLERANNIDGTDLRVLTARLSLAIKRLAPGRLPGPLLSDNSTSSTIVDQLFDIATRAQSAQYGAVARCCFEVSICIEPDYASAYSNLAVYLGNYDEQALALVQHSRALRLAPFSVGVLLNKASTLIRAQASERATRLLHHALCLEPAVSEVVATVAGVLREQLEFQASIRSWNRALAIRPDDPKVKVDTAVCFLLLGNYAEGWGLYEGRLRTESFWSVSRESRNFFERLPLFQRSAKSLSRRVLVWGEQGVGDEVMFGGLLREFRGLCGEMLLQVDRRLLGLFERALPGVRVFERGKAVPGDLYDEQIPMGSLGKWLRPSRESFEGKGGRYLRAQEGLGRRLREELGVGAQEKLIGLSWRSASAETGAARSVTLRELVGALQGVVGVRFVNLQYGDVSEEIEALCQQSGVEVLSHAGVDNREDLEGLAGLIEGCDLVVSVGNATAHLSGALGQRTWVLLPYVAGWRWLHEGESCPWYHSVRLYRQGQRGRWDSVLAKIKRDLG